MNLPTIYLLRHGQTEWNIEGRYQGELDSPLTQKGREQARENALKLKKYIDIDKVEFFSSPIGRAKETALIIADELALDSSLILFEEAIKEFNYGIFEGKTKAYCKSEFKEIFEAREADKWNYVLEGGESYDLVTKRLNVWLNSIEGKDTIVIVAHEMINRVLRGIYCNLKSTDMLRLKQPNDILIKLENSKEIEI